MKIAAGRCFGKKQPLLKKPRAKAAVRII